MEKKAARFLAVDLGAESGRVVVGHLDGEQLTLEELYRFPNGPVRVLDRLHWDVLRLWSEIKHGLGLAAQNYGDSLVGVGLDTWGVDFGLLASDDTLLGHPYHYRDGRTDGMPELAFRRVPREEIFERTGIQFMQFNSLYQLLAMAQAQAPALAAARTFLTMPDLFNFWLSGRKANEFTNATTTQCYDPRAADWAYDVLERLGLPTRIFGEIVPPGTVLGALRPSVAQETGCGQIPVIAPATHDTGSAVAAAPLSAPDAIYLSSGTWSLMGVEVEQPVISAQSLAYNFTNEGGIEGTFRLLKNIMGLWLVQESRRQWARTGESFSYAALTDMAAQAPAFGPLVAPGDARFLKPGDMPGRMGAFCRETGQVVPESRGAIVRCALESLALAYRWTAERLDELLGRRLPAIHVIGGGSQNSLLNQFTADATGRPVIAGPVEATAIGNILVQALALGHVSSLAQGRELVRRSFPLVTFEPQQAAAWDAAYERYERLMNAPG
jgi:rhamnulokinase